MDSSDIELKLRAVAFAQQACLWEQIIIMYYKYTIRCTNKYLGTYTYVRDRSYWMSKSADENLN